MSGWGDVFAVTELEAIGFLLDADRLHGVSELWDVALGLPWISPRSVHLRRASFQDAFGKARPKGGNRTCLRHCLIADDVV